MHAHEEEREEGKEEAEEHPLQRRRCRRARLREPRRRGAIKVVYPLLLESTRVLVICR